MKYLLIVVLALVLHQSLTLDLRSIVQSYAKYVLVFQERCEQESGVNPIEADRLLNPGILSDNDAFKHYAACLFRNLRLLNNDGTSNIDNYRIFIASEHPEIVNPLIEKCKPSGVGGNVQERVWNFLNCAFDAVKNMV
ncbi:uncharacterized protein LOC116158653 [Photinus pyralis]|uniref:uncharacterized protein LOC116158653 n=1 Tax=Photinus pyralis TaxID=7054 RepID=UPI0012676616|nr:uncharacterized protein LOC116158653 [Photinus pyralis]